jgi:hypothetical protein
MRSIALDFACPAIQARSRHTCLSLSWAFSERVVSSVQARDGHLFLHPRIAAGRRRHGEQDGVGCSEAHVMTAMATSRFYNVPGSERLLSVARRRLFRPSKQLRMIGGCCVQPIVRRAYHFKRRLLFAAYIADAMELFRCCYRRSETARNRERRNDRVTTARDAARTLLVNSPIEPRKLPLFPKCFTMLTAYVGVLS